MALILADRVKETSTTTGNGVFTLAGATTGFQSFAIVGNGNTTFYCIAGQGTSEWEVGIGTYASAGTTLTRTTVLSNSSATQPSALSFAAGTKDVFVTYPSEKSVNLDASGNATALGTPVAFTGTNITGTATSFTASNVTTNANLTGGVTSVGNAATVVTNANLTGGVTSVGNAATVVTNANLTGGVTSVGNAATVITNANLTGGVTSVGNAATVVTNANLTGVITSSGNATAIASQTGTGTTFVVNTSPVLVTPNLGTPTAGVLTNCTFPTLNQNTTGTAAKTNALNSATTVVNVSSATAPTVGQYLIATSSTAATWQTVAAPAPFAATTAMIFKQTAAPTGWTKVLTNDNSALRVVTGTAGTGGSVAFTTAFASQGVAGTNGASGATTLTTAQIAAHTHPLVGGPNAVTPASIVTVSANATPSSSNTGSSGGGGSHTHSAAAFTGTAINLAVAYVDVIVATKD